jgi:hypothetical protein
MMHFTLAGTEGDLLLSVTASSLLLPQQMWNSWCGSHEIFSMCTQFKYCEYIKLNMRVGKIGYIYLIPEI